MKNRIISLATAKKRFPTAIRMLDDVGDLLLWVDSEGRLHCDDAVHPGFDDMWDAQKKSWVGSSIETPEWVLNRER